MDDAEMKTVIATQARDIIATRRFDAPRALVWRAWTDPQMMAAWWGPETYTATATMDVREGGAFCLTMHSPDGGDYPIPGTFGEIIENETLVMIMRIDNQPEDWHAHLKAVHAGLGGIPEQYSRDPIVMRVTFSGDNPTTVTVRQTFTNTLMRDVHIGLGSGIGWNSSFNKLDAILAQA